MFRFILTKFWPALIPIALYLLWYVYKRHRLRNSEEVVRLTDGPWMMTIFAVCFIAAASFLWLRLGTDLNGPASYQPAMVLEGKVVDGELNAR
jgi:hypothetical protein